MELINSLLNELRRFEKLKSPIQRMRSTQLLNHTKNVHTWYE